MSIGLHGKSRASYYYRRDMRGRRSVGLPYNDPNYITVAALHTKLCSRTQNSRAPYTFCSRVSSCRCNSLLKMIVASKKSRRYSNLDATIIP